MKAFMVGAARTLIAPKNGIYRDWLPHELAAPVMRALLKQAGIKARDLQGVILGNALAAGGNPARVAALAAFSSEVPAVTIDTQCCSGLDAIGIAAAKISAGQAQVLIAGGVESFSQAPLRARQIQGGLIQPFTQAQFAPNQKEDPNVLLAAQAFANQRKIPRAEQERFAIESHRRALDSLTNDPFTRPLTQQICNRISARGAFAVTNATVAVQADAAAVLLLVNETIARHYPSAIEITHYATVGVKPSNPAQGGIAAGKKILSQLSARDQSSIVCAEIMESFAAQAIATISDLGLTPEMVNACGGMLARGHPIAASGAVLAGNLFLQLLQKPKGARGLAVIPAAGGLGSALMLRR